MNLKKKNLFQRNLKELEGGGGERKKQKEERKKKSS